MAVITEDIVARAVKFLDEYAEVIAGVCISGEDRWTCSDCADRVCRNHEDYMKVQRTIIELRKCIGREPVPSIFERPDAFGPSLRDMGLCDDDVAS